MKLRNLISAFAVLVFGIACLVNPLSALASHHEGVVTLDAKSLEGITLTNPFDKPADLLLHAKGEWNFRLVSFTNGDADGYAKGTCDKGCYSTKELPGSLLTLDSQTKTVLGAGKDQQVPVKPNQTVILVMNDITVGPGYDNNSGEQIISYAFY